MGKLEYFFQIHGLPEAAQKLRDLDKTASSVFGSAKGVNIGGGTGMEGFLSKLSPSILKLNPQLADMARHLKEVKNQASGIKTMPDWFLRQGAKSAMGMGELFPQKNWRQAGIGAFAGMFSPWIGARMLNSSGIFGGGGGAGGGGHGGGGLGGALFGAGGAMGFGEFYIGLIIAKNLLIKSMKELGEAFQKGFQVFSKAAQLGLRPGNLYQKELIGDISGLSSEQVDSMLLRQRTSRHLGQGAFSSMLQMSATRPIGEYAQQRTQFAANTMQETAGSLHRVVVESKIANADFKALWQQIASGLSGPFKDFMIQLDDLFKIIGQSDVLKAAVSELGIVFKVLNGAIGLVEVAISGLVTGFQAIGDAITMLMVGLNNAIAQIPGMGKLGFEDIELGDKPFEKLFAGTIKSALGTKELAQKVWDNLFGPEKAGALKTTPAMTGVSMASLATSSFEKMGFVIGSAKASEVPNLIRQTNAILLKIYQATSGMKPTSGPPSMSPMP